MPRQFSVPAASQPINRLNTPTDKYIDFTSSNLYSSLLQSSLGGSTVPYLGYKRKDYITARATLFETLQLILGH